VGYVLHGRRADIGLQQQYERSIAVKDQQQARRAPTAALPSPIHRLRPMIAIALALLVAAHATHRALRLDITRTVRARLIG
jgi:hypothetical protein